MSLESYKFTVTAVPADTGEMVRRARDLESRNMQRMQAAAGLGQMIAESKEWELVVTPTSEVSRLTIYAFTAEELEQHVKDEIAERAANPWRYDEPS